MLSNFKARPRCGVVRLSRSTHSCRHSCCRLVGYIDALPPPYRPAVFKDAFCFFLVPPSPRGSRGRVRTAVFLHKPGFCAGSGVGARVMLIKIIILTLSTAGIDMSVPCWWVLHPSAVPRSASSLAGTSGSFFFAVKVAHRPVARASHDGAACGTLILARSTETKNDPLEHQCLSFPSIQLC